ncbi:MAG TPA: hypothetical protein PLG50_01135 [bacterium]|nr:hypothetical protein [bacterium]HQG44246.1 hypothetical protein [bacterium]HQI48388.1 hypothetical protein [bacterium]HQJ63739.1 hypothetical protein [bacterium]
MLQKRPGKEWRRAISLAMSITFGLVGVLFLLIPEQVLFFFNRLSPTLGFVPSPVQGTGFYLILAAAYMYLVAVLAAMMFLHPDEPLYPPLLIHGKAASALLSLALFLFHGPFLIYLTNGLVDGAIAAAVYLLMRPVKRAAR